MKPGDYAMVKETRENIEREDIAIEDNDTSNKSTNKSAKALVITMELYQSIWNEFKYRHEHYWKTFFKLSLSVITLATIPHLEETKYKLINTNFHWILPVMGLVLILVYAPLLYGEHKRIDEISSSLKEIKSAHGVESVPSNLLGGIGNLSIAAFVFFLSLLCLGSLYLL